MNPALWTFLLSNSQTFFYTFVTKSMKALLDYACIFDIAEADRAVKLRSKNLGQNWVFNTTRGITRSAKNTVRRQIIKVKPKTCTSLFTYLPWAAFELWHADLNSLYAVHGGCQIASNRALRRIPAIWTRDWILLAALPQRHQARVGPPVEVEVVCSWWW